MAQRNERWLVVCVGTVDGIYLDEQGGIKWCSDILDAPKFHDDGFNDGRQDAQRAIDAFEYACKNNGAYARAFRKHDPIVYTVNAQFSITTEGKDA